MAKSALYSNLELIEINYLNQESSLDYIVLAFRVFQILEIYNLVFWLVGDLPRRLFRSSPKYANDLQNGKFYGG